MARPHPHTHQPLSNQVEGGRRRKSRWVQRDAEGRELRAFDRRQELEASLEAEAAAAGGVWLGQMVGDTWEIAPKAAPLALTQVLGQFTLTLTLTLTPSPTLTRTRTLSRRPAARRGIGEI